ncbi:MAG: pyridoxal phosphate-dependent aminotransferase [Pirellulales bacterium]
MLLAQRMQAVQSPIIPVVGEWIRQCPGTISLGQGVVHYGPPEQALARIQDFAAAQNHKYQPVDGIIPLRDALAAKLVQENGIALTEHNALVVTAGGNMAFFNALAAIADPGDEVILPTPYYFNHEMAVTMLSCRPVLAPTRDDYQLDVAAIADRITSRTRAVVTVSPNNPTGAVYSRESLVAVNELCRSHGLFHIHDEAYEYFVFDGAEHFSPASLPNTADYTISLFSLSKAYGFASWRIGYMVLPARLLTAVKKAQDTIVICPPVISQYAAAGALDAGRKWCRERIGQFDNVRAAVISELGRIKEFCFLPESRGALYFLLRIDAPLDPLTVAEHLIRDHSVAVIPGNTFGIDHGCYLRMSFGGLAGELVADGTGRLVRGLQAIVDRSRI